MVVLSMALHKETINLSFASREWFTAGLVFHGGNIFVFKFGNCSVSDFRIN